MARQEVGPSGLILFEKWMETTKWLVRRTQRWPKTLRASLTQRVENLAIAILEDVTTAAYVKARRARALRSADERLGRLRVLIRLAHELEVLGGSAYEEATARLAEAGRLIGGWRRQAATDG